MEFNQESPDTKERHIFFKSPFVRQVGEDQYEADPPTPIKSVASHEYYQDDKKHTLEGIVFHALGCSHVNAKPKGYCFCGKLCCENCHMICVMCKQIPLGTCHAVPLEVEEGQILPFCPPCAEEYQRKMRWKFWIALIVRTILFPFVSFHKEPPAIHPPQHSQPQILFDPNANLEQTTEQTTRQTVRQTKPLA